MSIDIKMAWRNIWRNTRRTILTICAIAFASLLLVFMLSFQFGSYETMINTSVKIHTGHLQIQAKDYQKKKDIRLVVAPFAELAAILESIRRSSLIHSEDKPFHWFLPKSARMAFW